MKLILAVFKSLGMANAGPTPIKLGGTPTTLYDTYLPNIGNPKLFNIHGNFN